MDQTNIDNFRQRLVSERGDLESQLVDMGMDPATGQPNGVDFDHSFADSGQNTEEKARVLAIAEGLIEIKREVDAAIEKIEGGTFGTCESCGKHIGDERLDARPYARLCMDCKRRTG